MERRLGDGKSLVARGEDTPKAPRAFADPLASRQEAPSASAGNAGSTPPRSIKGRCDRADVEQSTACGLPRGN
jgi:hypothetical protein